MDATSESRFKKLREELDCMGYHQPLSFESVPLVEKLLLTCKNCQSNVYQCNKTIRLKRRKIAELNAALTNFEEEYCKLKAENEVLLNKLKFEKDNFSQMRKKLKNQITELENKVVEFEFVSSEQNILLNEYQDRFNLPSDFKKQAVKNSMSSDCLKNRHGLDFANLDLVNEFIFNLLTVREGVTQEMKSLKQKQSKLLEDLKLSRSKALNKNETTLDHIEDALEDNLNVCRSKSCQCYCQQLGNSQCKALSKAQIRSSIPAKGQAWSMKKKLYNDCISRSESVKKDENPNIKDNKGSQKTAMFNLKECTEKRNDSVPRDVLEERDYYYREYQRLKDKILILLKDKHPKLDFSDCPHDSLDLLEEMLSLNTSDRNNKTNNEGSKIQEPTTVQNNFKVGSGRNELFSAEKNNYEYEALRNKIASLEYKCDSMENRIDSLTKEVMYYKLNSNEFKLLLEKTEYNLQTLQEAKKKSDFELHSALSKLDTVTEQKVSAEKKNSLLDMERDSLLRYLKDLDNLKDSISHDLDAKSEEIKHLNDMLRNERLRRDEITQQLCIAKETLRRTEEASNKLNEKLRVSENDNFKADLKVKEMKNLVKQLTAENSCLKDELDIVQSSFVKSSNEIRMAKCEIEELKSKMQTYVSEVRQIEDLLQSKETERHSLLLQLKGQSDRDFASTSKIPCSNLSTDTINDLQDRLHSYEKEVYDKDEMLLNMKTEIEMLKEKVENFELEAHNH